MAVVIPFLVQVGASFLGASAVLAAGLTFVASVGVAAYQKSRAARKAREAYNASLQDRLVMTATTDGPGSRLYGRVRNVDGVLFKGSWGDKRENYTLVVAFAMHECDAIEQIYFGDQPVTIENTIVTTAPWGSIDPISETVSYTGTGLVNLQLNNPRAGSVTVLASNTGEYSPLAFTLNGNTLSLDLGPGQVSVTVDYQSMQQRSFARVYPFLGAPGQDISGLLAQRFPGLVNGSHRFAGICLAVVDMLFDQTAFPNGVPVISARVRGARVLDPRTGVTAWSENPALCARDWALYQHGGGLDADELHEQSFITAANDCDTQHTYTDSAGGSVTGPLFRCAYVAKTDGSPEAHFAELVEAMAGKHGWPGGQLKVRAGVYHGPVATVTEAWSSDKELRQITSARSLADSVNIGRVTIADAAQQHITVPLPPLRAAAYIAEDGQELVQEVTMGAVSFAPQALHIMGVMMRDARFGQTANWPCTLQAFGLELFDVIYLDTPRYGWTGSTIRTFEVLGTKLNLAANVLGLTLKETQASIQQPDALFLATDSQPNTSLPRPWELPTMTGLQVVSGDAQLLVQSDGSVVSRASVTFDPINSEAVLNGGAIELSWKTADSQQWQSQEFAGASTRLLVAGLKDGAWHLFRARVKSRLAVGPWSAQIMVRLLGKLARPPRVDNFTIRAMPDGTRILEGGYLASTRPADLAGYRIRYRQGLGPYTWADLRPFQTDDGFITSLPLETNLLLAGEWTLAIVGLDTSGNESADVNVITATLPNPRLGDSIKYRSLEVLNWPGTVTDAVRVTDASGAAYLRARDQTTWATLPSTWAAWTRWVWDPVASWSYETDVDDLGASVQVLPVVSVDVVGDYLVNEQHSLDGTTWTAWEALAAPFLARYVRLRVQLSAQGATGPGVTQITSIRAMTVVYTGRGASETGDNLDPTALGAANRLAVGRVRLPLSRPYVVINQVFVTTQNTGPGWSVNLIDKNPTLGPLVEFYNASDLLADPPLFDFTVQGIAQ